MDQKRHQGRVDCRITMPTTEDEPTGAAIQDLTLRKSKLHGRCLVLFSELIDAHARITEFEGVIFAMRYAEKHMSKSTQPCTMEYSHA